MAIPEPGTVLECAIGPCTNPAEVTIHTPGYGPYPPLIFSVCQVCFDAFGSTLTQWPKVPLLYQPTKEISREELERSLASHKDAITLSSPPTITRTHIDAHGAVHMLPAPGTAAPSPYVMTGMVKASPHPYPWPPVPVGEMDIRAGSLTSKYDEVEDPPSYLDDALTFANMALLAALDEELRRIEVHPASNPPIEPEQHAPGWLPGDE